VEAPLDPILHKLGRISSHEREWVVRLRVDVDAKDLEARTVISNGSAASTTEQVK
jgi:hypothetical protein